jgi:hypothetical protein
MIQVWSCGGGTQSAAIAALIIQGKLPKPDYSVIADTGREKSSTWRYVNGVLIPRLAEVGVDLVIVPKEQYATVDLYRNDDLLIPAYTNISGEISKLPAFCSNEWKSRVVDRWLRDQGVTAGSYVTWIGYSANELRRVRALPSRRYVLIYDVKPRPMFREDCHSVATYVFGVPPPRGGSACWMCPNMRDSQWRDMRGNDPEDFERAVGFDEEIRTRDPHVFLHETCKPLADVQFGNSNQMELGCDSGMCYV